MTRTDIDATEKKAFISYKKKNDNGATATYTALRTLDVTNINNYTLDFDFAFANASNQSPSIIIKNKSGNVILNLNGGTDYSKKGGVNAEVFDYASTAQTVSCYVCDAPYDNYALETVAEKLKIFNHVHITADEQNGTNITISYSVDGDETSKTVKISNDVVFIGDIVHNIGRYYGGAFAIDNILFTKKIGNFDYTINYVKDEQIVKTDEGNAEYGTKISTLYKFVDENTAENLVRDAEAAPFVVILDDQTTFNIPVHEARVLTYTVKNSLGTTIYSGSGQEGEIYEVVYPKYVLNGTDLYLAETSTGIKSFTKYITLTDNIEATVNYTKSLENIVYFSEAEDVTGAKKYNSCSNTATFASGDLAVFDNLAKLTTLTSGTYKIYARTLGRTDKYFEFFNGNGDDKVLLFKPTAAGFYNCGEQVSNVLLISEPTEIYVKGGYATTSTNGHVIDLFYIEKVSDFQKLGDDITSCITNPSFESGTLNTANNVSGWVATGGMKIQNNTSFAKVGTNYAESWQPSATTDINQTITNLPAGTYRLSAIAKARGVQSAKLYANTNETAMTIADEHNTYTVEFVLDGETDLKIGAQAVGNGATSSWFCIDDFHLTYVAPLAVSVSVPANTGMTTFCSPYNLDFSEATNIKAYKGVVDGASVKLAQINDVVPAGTGVLLVAEGGAEENIPVTTESGSIDDNQFVGVLTSTEISSSTPGTNYVLAYNGADIANTLGFYSIGGTSATVGAGKAYLNIPAAGINARLSIEFGDGELTGIDANEAEEVEETEGEAINISGLPVNASFKGIMIKNGQKIYNK